MLRMAQVGPLRFSASLHDVLVDADLELGAAACKAEVHVFAFDDSIKSGNAFGRY